LANLGIGLDTSVASADEVLNAKEQQKPKKTKLNDKQFAAMIIAIGQGKHEQVEQRIEYYTELSLRATQVTAKLCPE
jgi:hypothetical protein